MRIDPRNHWRIGPDTFVVVWANVGFKVSSRPEHAFEAIFATNCSRKAAQIDPKLRYWWAEHCRSLQKNTNHLYYPWEKRTDTAGVIVVPTKPMVVDAPWTSWMQSSPPEYFRKQVSDMCWFVRRVYKARVVLHVPEGQGEVSADFAREVFAQFATTDDFILAR